MSNVGAGCPAVRLFPDYGRDWPLWSRNMAGLDYPVSPADLGLSDSLLDLIIRWNTEWENNFHWDRGWKEGYEARRWADEGDAIAKLLEVELPGIMVSREYDWCLPDNH